MQIVKTKIPINSILYFESEKYNYYDSYEGIINDKNNLIGITDVAKAFLKTRPKWIDCLLNLRNKIAPIIGLKSHNNINEIKPLTDSSIIPGKQVGLFKVCSTTDNEIILGGDDKHLNFRVSLFLERPENNNSVKIITVTTLVIFNNWLGRIYFLPVKPFHKLIIRIILKKNLQALEFEANKLN